MKGVTSWVLLGVSLLLLGFGLACFNFTKPSALEHHTRVAAENNWPAPSDRIVLLGVVSAIMGASGSCLAIRGTITRHREEK